MFDVCEYGDPSRPVVAVSAPVALHILCILHVYDTVYRPGSINVVLDDYLIFYHCLQSRQPKWLKIWRYTNNDNNNNNRHVWITDRDVLYLSPLNCRRRWETEGKKKREKKGMRVKFAGHNIIANEYRWTQGSRALIKSNRTTWLNNVFTISEIITAAKEKASTKLTIFR